MKDLLILLLAAGASSRMKGPDKMLEPVDNTPLLRVMAQRCAKAGATRVVLGPDQPDRRKVLQGVSVEIVEATGTDGMAASIRAGVDGVRDRPVMIVLADMPGIRAEDLHLLSGLYAGGTAAILRAAGADGRPGHPVIFAPDYLGQLARLSGDRGAGSILKANARDVALIPLPGQRALTDLDTPEDWAAWRAAGGDGT